MAWMSELMVWKACKKSAISVISCPLRLQHSLCTCARMFFLMLLNLDSRYKKNMVAGDAWKISTIIDIEK